MKCENLSKLWYELVSYTDKVLNRKEPDESFSNSFIFFFIELSKNTIDLAVNAKDIELAKLIKTQYPEYVIRLKNKHWKYFGNEAKSCSGLWRIILILKHIETGAIDIGLSRGKYSEKPCQDDLVHFELECYRQIAEVSGYAAYKTLCCDPIEG